MTTLKEEEPYAAAVLTEKISTTCSKCFAWNPVDLERVKLSRCAGCHVVHYCSPKCQKEDWKEHKTECKLLRSADFVPSEYARMVLRMIEKSRKQPDFKAYNGRTYDSLMDHSSMRRQNAKSMANATKIYCEICIFMGSKAPDFQTFFLVLSKFAINAFEILEGSCAGNSRGIGLYLGLSVLDHSCRPDAYVINQGSKLMLRTTKKDLVYSDKLTIAYGDGNFFLDTEMRRAKLYDSYFFVCQCEECLDVESNEKRMSGRPPCCPNSWFSTADRICNKCKQEVSSELADKALDAMKLVNGAVSVFENGQLDRSALLVLVPDWIKLFDSYKKVLSDENTSLFAIANMIYSTAPSADLACKYADLCIPQAGKSPQCAYRTMLLVRRHRYYELAKKPLPEATQALDEALDDLKVVFGWQHELTKSLLEKKVLYNLMTLRTR